MKKGEILFYSNNAVDINNKGSFIKTIGFPTEVNVNVIFAGSFMPVPKGAKVPEVPAVKEYRFTFEIKNLPQKFFPFLITFYGKDLNSGIVLQKTEMPEDVYNLLVNNRLNKLNGIFKFPDLNRILFSKQKECPFKFLH